MQKPYISNRKLHEIQFNEQNMYFTKKLAESKSYINYESPESFDFYKKEFKPSSPKHKLRDIEINSTNKLLFKKLNIIRNISPQLILEKIKPFRFSKKKYDGGLTREQRYLMKISNKIYSKGIRKQKSVINIKKLEDDFEKSKKYKENICKLPVLDFQKVNSNSNSRDMSPRENLKERTCCKEVCLSNQRNAFADTVFIRMKFIHEKSTEKSKNKKGDYKNKTMIRDDKKKNEDIKENNNNKNENDDKNKNKAFWVTDLNKEKEKDVKK